jgi:cyclophilin family peptidyl-prolyl cis-trans isomerase
MTIDASKTYTARMHTSEGTMTFQLLPQEAPITVNNFVFLAREGFYEGVKFHRIIEGFMVQSGDPTGTGGGGPGYTFQDEQVTRDYLRGTLAMANAGPNTNGSQFFIVHRDAGLPKLYNIFGFMIEGEDVLDKIAKTTVTISPFGERSQPTRDVVINRIEIIEQP